MIPGENQIITDAMAKGDAGTIEAMRDLFNLNDPYVVRYFKSLGNVFNGTFGISGTTGGEVGSFLFERMSISMQIGAIAIALSFLIGIPIGVFLARRNNF
jgi:peptide/nickel transport system permease protein